MASILITQGVYLYDVRDDHAGGIQAADLLIELVGFRARLKVADFHAEGRGDIAHVGADVRKASDEVDLPLGGNRPVIAVVDLHPETSRGVNGSPDAMKAGLMLFDEQQGEAGIGMQDNSGGVDRLRAQGSRREDQ